mmetsp:Transcript_2068/g.4652  ORF Transcript_2068/g.4652 Transcript_2068/m.4652 type:complete len:796 (-) Transcript_2068:383-2770(-)
MAIFQQGTLSIHSSVEKFPELCNPLRKETQHLGDNVSKKLNDIRTMCSLVAAPHHYKQSIYTKDQLANQIMCDNSAGCRPVTIYGPGGTFRGLSIEGPPIRSSSTTTKLPDIVPVFPTKEDARDAVVKALKSSKHLAPDILADFQTSVYEVPAIYDSKMKVAKVTMAYIGNKGSDPSTIENMTLAVAELQAAASPTWNMAACLDTKDGQSSLVGGCPNVKLLQPALSDAATSDRTMDVTCDVRPMGECQNLKKLLNLSTALPAEKVSKGIGHMVSVLTDILIDKAMATATPTAPSQLGGSSDTGNTMMQCDLFCPEIGDIHPPPAAELAAASKMQSQLPTSTPSDWVARRLCTRYVLQSSALTNLLQITHVAESKDQRFAITLADPLSKAVLQQAGNLVLTVTNQLEISMSALPPMPADKAKYEICILLDSPAAWSKGVKCAKAIVDSLCQVLSSKDSAMNKIMLKIPSMHTNGNLKDALYAYAITEQGAHLVAITGASTAEDVARIFYSAHESRQPLFPLMESKSTLPLLQHLAAKGVRIAVPSATFAHLAGALMASPKYADDTVKFRTYLQPCNSIGMTVPIDTRTAQPAHGLQDHDAYITAVISVTSASRAAAEKSVTFSAAMKEAGTIMEQVGKTCLNRQAADNALLVQLAKTHVARSAAHIAAQYKKLQQEAEAAAAQAAAPTLLDINNLDLDDLTVPEVAPADSPQENAFKDMLGKMNMLSTSQKAEDARPAQTADLPATKLSFTQAADGDRRAPKRRDENGSPNRGASKQRSRTAKRQQTATQPGTKQ